LRILILRILRIVDRILRELLILNELRILSSILRRLLCRLNELRLVILRCWLLNELCVLRKLMLLLRLLRLLDELWCWLNELCVLRKLRLWLLREQIYGILRVATRCFGSRNGVCSRLSGFGFSHFINIYRIIYLYKFQFTIYNLQFIITIGIYLSSLILLLSA